MLIFGRRRLLRYRTIILTFVRHGFGTFFDRLGVLGHLRLRRKHIPRNTRLAERTMTVGERLRCALQELGPTFIKLGQILSTRPDILPRDVILELEKLQDSVPPFPYEELRREVETSLEDRIENLFKDFDPVPLAAASIAQVHRATAHDGRQVVVKVLRPDVQSIIEQDLLILQDLARFLDTKTKYGELYDFTGMAKEFENTILTELDFRIEGENTDTLREYARKDEGVKVPDILWTHTTKRVLTMEFIDGYSVKDLEKADFHEVDKKKVARRLTTSVLNQILRDGFFHADPHPGNLIFMKDGTVAFIDLGMVGKLNGDRRVQFMKMMAGLVQKDSRMLVQAIMDLDAVSGPVNMRRLESELDRLRDRYLEVPIENIKLGALFGEIFSLAFSYRIRLPSEFTMLSKTLATLEGVVERIAPDVSLYEVAAPIAQERAKEMFSPEHILRAGVRGATEYGRLLSGLPGFLSNFIRKVEDENYTVKLRHEGFEEYMGKINRAVNRISISIALLAISIIVAGLAVALGAGLPPEAGLELTVTTVLQIGLAVILALFIWLVASVIHSRK